MVQNKHCHSKRKKYKNSKNHTKARSKSRRANSKSCSFIRHVVAWCELQWVWATPTLWPCQLQPMWPFYWVVLLPAACLSAWPLFLSSPTSWSLHWSLGFSLIASSIVLSWATWKESKLSHALPLTRIWVEASMTHNSFILYTYKTCGQHLGLLQALALTNLGHGYNSLWVLKWLNPGNHFPRWPREL